MIGYFKNKLYIAILGDGKDEISRMKNTIHSWYLDIKIKTYQDSASLFEAINLNKLQNHPFDAVYVNSEQKAEKMILNRSIPELPVFTYNNSLK
jgi:hypothetical protein